MGSRLPEHYASGTIGWHRSRSQWRNNCQLSCRRRLGKCLELGYGPQYESDCVCDDTGTVCMFQHLPRFLAYIHKFGHNDQKPVANISLARYATNLGQFVDDVRQAGAIPILVTPLTRRSFTGSPPRIVESLADQRNATIGVALQRNSRWIDLNAASEKYCNAIGPTASWTYNLNPDDHTHLNDWGSVVFGRLVSDLLIAKYDDIGEWTVPNKTLSRELKEGLPA